MFTCKLKHGNDICPQGGQWMLNLVDFYGGTLLIFALAMFEVVVVFWLYGIENFCWDLEYMTGRKASLYWRLCWTIVSPLFMIFIFAYSMAYFVAPQYGRRNYPSALTAVGWSIFGFGFAMFPVLALAALWLARLARPPSSSSWWQTVKEACTPSSKWGPEDAEQRARWFEFKTMALERRMKMAERAGHSMLKQKLYIICGWY